MLGAIYALSVVTIMAIELKQAPTHKKASTSSRIELWVKKLPQTALAIDQNIAQKLQYLLNASDCSNDQIAKLIQQDPIACLKLFQLTDKRVKKKDGDIQGLVHLISLTGSQALKNILHENRAVKKQPQGLQELLAASLFAGTLASEFIGEKYHCSRQRFFLPTLFFNAPLWLSWSAAPKLMSQGQQLASRKNKSYINLSEKHMGFCLPELLKKSDQYIHLPEYTQKTLDIDPRDNIQLWAKLHRFSQQQLDVFFSKNKKAMHYFYSIEMGIYLFNQYALAIYLDWKGKHRERYERILCRYLKQPRSSFRKRVKELSIAIRLPDHYDELLKPSNRYFGLHRDCESTEQKDSDLSPWLKKIHQCNTVNTALEMTLKALTKGVGVDHCVIMDVAERNINTQATHGFERSCPINRLHIDRKQSHNLFNQLTRQPACLHLTQPAIKKAAKKIPVEFSKHCDLQPCGLLSIFHHHKPKALIYCDHKNWNQEKYNAFKKVGRYLSLTLQQIH